MSQGSSQGFRPKTGPKIAQVETFQNKGSKNTSYHKKCCHIKIRIAFLRKTLHFTIIILHKNTKSVSTEKQLISQISAFAKTSQKVKHDCKNGYHVHYMIKA